MLNLVNYLTNFIHWLFIFFLLVVSLPLQIIISTLLYLSSGFPILYHQKRLGKNGKIFTLHKFRTMKRNADTLKFTLMKQNEASGPVFKIRDDPRFTPLGKFLSHTGLDELPQLYNILMGDMSLFGPRPLPVSEAKKLSNWQQKRHCIKPGIISPWILNGYHKQTFTEWMRRDISYIKQKSIESDTILFFKTIFFLVTLFFTEVKKTQLHEKSVSQTHL